MVILIQQRKDPDDRITYGGPMGRIGIWRYLIKRFPESERIFIEQDIKNIHSIMGRFFSGFNNLIRIIVELVKSNNKVVLLSYPDFPYCSPLDFSTFFKALIFMTILKVIKGEGINQPGKATMEEFKGTKI